MLQILQKFHEDTSPQVMEITGLSDASSWQECKVRTYAVKHLFTWPSRRTKRENKVISVSANNTNITVRSG